MKRFSVVTAAVAILVVAGMTSTASAQRQGGRGFGGRGFGAMGLLRMEEVQKELNLTSEQKEKLQDLGGQRGDTQNLSREERQKRFQEMAKKADETIKNTLDEKQQKRLEELVIQREGATALTRPAVAKKLGLDEAQQEKVKKIVADNAQANRPNFQNATQEERQKFLAEVRERREKENTALLAVLTADQKKAFEKMEGEKFTFPRFGRNRNQNQ